MNFDSAEIQALLDEYKHLNYDTIFKFDSIIEKYGDYAKFVTANKVNLGFSTIDDEMKGIRPGEVCYIISPTNVGKCHGAGQGVLLADGRIKKVEDVIVGDYLAGINNTKRRVLSVASGVGELFKVNQKWGKPYVVNSEHILSLRRALDSESKKNGEIINIPILEYIGKAYNFKKFYKGWKDTVNFAEKPLMIDPYILGLWLGDGKSDSPVIYSADEEIITAVKNYAQKNGQDFRAIKEKSNCFKLTITNRNRNRDGFNFRRELRVLGLINAKHIPRQYKINSEENRLKLLAGLIDTDGWVNRHKSKHGARDSYSITTTNKRLAEDIMFLVGSLGFRTNTKEKISRIKSINYSVKSYTVYISGDVEKIPVLIKRKKTKNGQRKRIFNYSNITSIEPLGVGQYFGFTLDGDGLYLLGDFTVTHNTALSMNILKHNIKGDTIIPFFSLENNEYQTFERMIQLELNVSSFEIENNFKNNNQSFISECQEVSEKWSNVINIVKRVSLEDIIPYIKVCEKLTDKKVKFVLIDYAQLIKCTGKEYEKVSEIAQQLKEISLNLRIPLIVLSQVSRQEARNENGLTLYSAKGSGEIENSAQILFSLERLKEINQEVLDGKTLARNDKGDCAILKLKTLKKKRGKDLKEILIILNYPSLRMMEYSQQVQSEVQFDKQPF